MKIKFKKYFYYREFNEEAIDFTFCAIPEVFEDSCIAYALYKIAVAVIGMILPLSAIGALCILSSISWIFLLPIWVVWITIFILLYYLVAGKTFEKRNRDILEERKKYYEKLKEQEKEKYETYITTHPLEYKCKKALEENNPHNLAELINYIKQASEQNNNQ